MTAHTPLERPTSASVQLSGWRLALAWSALALIVAWGVALHVRAAPVFAEVVFVAEPAFAQLHLTASRAEGTRVAPKSGGVADVAGLPAGRLVAVDGQPVPAGATLLDAGRLLRGDVGEPVRLTVATATRDTVTAAVVRTSAPSPDVARAGLNATVARFFELGVRSLVNLTALLVAVALFLRRRRSLVALVGAGTFLLLGIWSSVLDVHNQVTADGSLWGMDGVVRALVFALLLFLALFPDGRARPRWSIALPMAYAGTLGLIPLLPSPAIRGVVWAVVPVGLVLLGALAQVLRYRRTASDDQRLQTKWAALGLVGGVLMVASGIVLMVAGPAEAGTGWFLWKYLLGDVLFAGFILMPLGVGMSLLRYRLWDAEAAWSRSAMAAALTLVLTAIVAGGTALVQAALGTTGPLALAIATAAAAVFFVPLQRRLSEWADHRFLRDLTDLKEKLPDLVAHLRETESVEGIAEAVTDRVLPAVHAAHVALVVPEGDGWRTVGTEAIDPASVDAWAESAGLASPPDMAPRRRQPWRAVVWRDASDRRFPVRVALRAERAGGETATEGWLLLGPRPDGSGYGPDDLEAVAAVAGPVGRALRVVRVREAREAARTARADALADGLREVRDALRALRTAAPDP